MAGWRATLGKPRVPRSAAVLGGGAILLWVAVVALNPVSRPRSGDESISPPGTNEPGSLPIGPYLVWNGPGVGVDITVTLTSAGWRSLGDGILLKNDNPIEPETAGLIVFPGTTGAVAEQSDLYIYRDACRWSGARPDAPVATADDAAAALAIQASSEPSAPVEVAVGPYPGKAVTLRVPDDVQLDRCDQGQLRFFIEGEDNDNVRSGYVPGQIDELWIVSAGNPARLVIFDIVYDDAISDGLVEELREMVEAATFK